METLTEAFAEYERRKAAGEQPLALVIDFVAGGTAARVDFRFASVDRKAHGLDIESPPLWRTLALTDAYVRRNQELILADAFGGEADRAVAALRRLRGAAREGPVHE